MESTVRTVQKWLSAAVLLMLSSTTMAGADQVRGTFWESLVCPTNDGYSEEIYLSGSYRMLMQHVDTGNHITSTFQVFWEADGWGASGSEYLLHGKWMEVVQENPPYIFLWNDHFRLIGKGNADNYEVHFKVRIIVNANGDPVVEFVDEKQCETLDFGMD
jgi:hypothetical protein